MIQNLDPRANEQALAEQKKRAKRERVAECAEKRLVINTVLRGWSIPGRIDEAAGQSCTKKGQQIF